MPKFTPQVKAELISTLKPLLRNLDPAFFYADESMGGEVEVCLIQDMFEEECPDVVSGCTKVVLIFRNIPDWVVKIPLLGGTYYDEDYDEEVHSSFEGRYIDELDERISDYCALEEYFYQKAINSSVEEMFAGTFYLMEINGLPIYVSERVYEDVFSYRCSPNWHSRQIANRLWNSSNTVQESRLSPEKLSIFVEQYGTDAAEMLTLFIDIYDIQDLHAGNLGYDKSNMIKIIDYSGFYD